MTLRSGIRVLFSVDQVATNAIWPGCDGVIVNSSCWLRQLHPV
jgi:hypothetical protein